MDRVRKVFWLTQRDRAILDTKVPLQFVPSVGSGKWLWVWWMRCNQSVWCPMRWHMAPCFDGVWIETAVSSSPFYDISDDICALSPSAYGSRNLGSLLAACEGRWDVSLHLLRRMWLGAIWDNAMHGVFESCDAQGYGGYEVCTTDLCTTTWAILTWHTSQSMCATICS